ncbi:MAG: hypothetical protein WA840_11740 [Caulobacteraceae bacterium]
MRVRPIGAALLAACLSAGLAGCNGPVSESRGHTHGRYAGVGIYLPGELWSKMVQASAPASPSQARTADDEHVIVVVDGDTGEIRQCGDLSGYCVGMNPWTRTLVGPQVAPVQLSAHAGDGAKAKPSAAP